MMRFIKLTNKNKQSVYLRADLVGEVHPYTDDFNGINGSRVYLVGMGDCTIAMENPETVIKLIKDDQEN